MCLPAANILLKSAQHIDSCLRGKLAEMLDPTGNFKVASGGTGSNEGMPKK